MAWRLPTTRLEEAERLLGPTRDRVHAVEYRWLDEIRTTTLFAYRFEAALFRPVAADGHAHVCDHAVRPLGQAEEVGDFLALHEAAGIELRLMNNLWPYWTAVTKSTMGFSGIRLPNAHPPDQS